LLFPPLTLPLLPLLLLLLLLLIGGGISRVEGQEEDKRLEGHAGAT